MPSETFWKINIQKIHREAPVPDSVLNAVAGLSSATLLQKRHQRICFPVNFVGYLGYCKNRRKKKTSKLTLRQFCKWFCMSKKF